VTNRWWVFPMFNPFLNYNFSLLLQSIVLIYHDWFLLCYSNVRIVWKMDVYVSPTIFMMQVGTFVTKRNMFICIILCTLGGWKYWMEICTNVGRVWSLTPNIHWVFDWVYILFEGEINTNQRPSVSNFVDLPPFKIPSQIIVTIIDLS
jgi:hypothetical protein